MMYGFLYLLYLFLYINEVSVFFLWIIAAFLNHNKETIFNYGAKN